MFRFCIIIALAFTVNAGFLHKNDIDNAGDANDLFADESEDLEGSTDKIDEVGDAGEADDEEGAEDEEEEEETAAMKDGTMVDSSDTIAKEAADEDFTGGLTSEQKRDSTDEIASEAVDKDFTGGLTSRQAGSIKDRTTVQTVVTAVVASAQACGICTKALWTKEVPAIRNCMQHESMYYKQQEDAHHDVKKKCGAEARMRVHAAAIQCKSQCAETEDKKSSLLSIHVELVSEEQLEEAATSEAAALAPKAALLQASTDLMASTQARHLMKLVQQTSNLASEDNRISKETVVARQMAAKLLGDTKMGAEVSALLTKAVSEANRAAAGERHLAAIEAHQVQNLVHPHSAETAEEKAFNAQQEANQGQADADDRSHTDAGAFDKKAKMQEVAEDKARDVKVAVAMPR